MPAYFRSSGNGCLLPALILSNLLFGWMVFRPLWIWLAVGFVLVFIFGLQLYLSLKLFMRAGSKKQKGDVIDIQAQALDEQDKEG